MTVENELTIITAAFEKVDDMTTSIDVIHSGFKQDDNWSEALQWHEMAWSGVLESLKSALEKDKGNLCCTTTYTN
jgi:hypothetical protein